LKIRIMGTKDECALAGKFFKELEQKPSVKYASISGLYANRGSAKLYRLYVEIEYNETIEKGNFQLTGKS